MSAKSKRDHALLSASGASRWINCPPSARLEDTFPDSTTEYAEEGTLAHAIGELKLRKEFVDPMGPRAFNNRIKKFRENPLYQKEMLDHTEAYLEYIQSLVHQYNAPPFIAVETKVDFSAWVPEGFGTCDCIVIGENVLNIIDFKYGRSFVEAEENPQMKLYSLGALVLYGVLFNIEKVVLHIIQPRVDNISSFALTPADLMKWGESIKAIAQTSFNGEGEFNSGDHCKFCKAKHVCRARSENFTALEDFGYKKSELLSNAEIGEILSIGRNLKNWLSDIESYALSECLKGNDIPGWKAVEGRSNRRISDVDSAFENLISNGYDEAILYERKPLTLTQIEKLVPKKQFEELLGKYIIKPPGKPTIVQESDNREAISNRVSAQSDFNIGG